MDDKKTLYSAIQPTNNLTIGNYVGAISNWLKLQDEYNCFATKRSDCLRFTSPAESTPKSAVFTFSPTFPLTPNSAGF